MIEQEMQIDSDVKYRIVCKSTPSADWSPCNGIYDSEEEAYAMVDKYIYEDQYEGYEPWEYVVMPTVEGHDSEEKVTRLGDVLAEMILDGYFTGYTRSASSVGIEMAKLINDPRKEKDKKLAKIKKLLQQPVTI